MTDHLAATEEIVEAAKRNVGVFGVEGVESVPHKTLEVALAVGDEDTKLTEENGVLLVDEHDVAALEARLHAVAADAQSEIGLLGGVACTHLDAFVLAAAEDRVFDAWDECFSYEAWCDIFDRAGIDPAFYANRAFDLDEILPWDMIDCGVTKEFLLRERARAYQEKTTPSCAEHCSGCGASCLGGKAQWCP